MASTVSREDVWASREPVIIIDFREQEVVRYLYEMRDGSGKRDRPAATVEMVLRHKRTGERQRFRFVDVVPDSMPPVRSEVAIAVWNHAVHGWETPRGLGVMEYAEDGESAVLFWAADVEVSDA